MRNNSRENGTGGLKTAVFAAERGSDFEAILKTIENGHPGGGGEERDSGPPHGQISRSGSRVPVTFSRMDGLHQTVWFTPGSPGFTF